MLMPGEVVVPTAMVKAGAVDHLRGRLPGFAAGGLVTPMPGVWGERVENSYAADARGAVGSAAAAAFRAVTTSVTNALRQQMMVGPASGGGHVSWVPGAGVNQWRQVVQSALAQLGLSPLLVLDVLYQMMTESGGNPNIVNKWDSNWAAGHPSVGLMQVIAGTFATYAGPYRNTGPFLYGVSVNPMANVYAALNYAAHNGRGFGTGPGQVGSGHGYDSGGWLPPGISIAVNNTGRPEQVLPPGRSAGAGGGTVTVVIENRGVIGSRAELKNWLARSVDELAREGRLAYALRRSPSAA